MQEEYDALEDGVIDGDPGDEQVEIQTPPAPEPPRGGLAYDEETIEALVNARAQKLVEEKERANAPKPTETYVDPYDRAANEAKEAGKEWDSEWISRRAIKHVQEEARRDREALKAEMYGEVGKVFGPIAQERIAKSAVGDDPIAQDTAIKLMQKGIDINDPDIKEIIKRSAESVAAEKQAKKGTYEAYNPQTPRYSPQEVRELDEIEAILKSVNPKATIKGAKN